jgi:hypothetical protein
MQQQLLVRNQVLESLHAQEEKLDAQSKQLETIKEDVIWKSFVRVVSASRRKQRIKNRNGSTLYVLTRIISVSFHYVSHM